MNLLETMNIGTESCETMRKSESEEQQKMQSLQDTISKCKMLLKEQAGTIAELTRQKVKLMEDLRAKSEAYDKLLQRMKKQKENAEQELSGERSRNSYLSRLLCEKEEELAKEKAKTAEEKFREKHKFFRRTPKIKTYYKMSWWEKHGEQVLFILYCVTLVIVAF